MTLGAYIIADSRSIIGNSRSIIEDSRSINDTSRVVRMMIVSDATIWSITTDDSGVIIYDHNCL